MGANQNKRRSATIPIMMINGREVTVRCADCIHHRKGKCSITEQKTLEIERCPKNYWSHDNRSNENTSVSRT